MFLTMQKINGQGNNRFVCRECQQDLTSLIRFVDQKGIKLVIVNIKKIGNNLMPQRLENAEPDN